MRCPSFRFRIRPVFLILCVCTLLTTLCLGNFSKRLQPIAYATDARQLVQTGIELYQTGDFLEAVEPWQLAYEAYQTTQDFPALAVVSENLARAYQQMGQTSEEIAYWEQAIATIQTLGNQRKLNRLLTEQAQAYSRLGQHRRAIAILCGSETEPCKLGSALQIAKEAGDHKGQVAALGSLGEAYRLSGGTQTALDYLKQGHALSRELSEPALEAAILNSLGNVSVSLAQVNYRRADEAQGRGDRLEAKPLQSQANKFNTQAIKHFQQSYDLALAQQDIKAQLQALLSLIPAYERGENLSEAHRHQELALFALNQLPNSQIKAFAAIKLANFLEPLEIRNSQTQLNSTSLTPSVESQATTLLNQAVAIGEAIENPRVISFALGKLGNLDERFGRYAAALEKTYKARLAADQNLAARDSLYLWDWQLGRIYKKQGKLKDSAQAYGKTIALLEQIRNDILNANRDLQFDFRDALEPIYRQYAELNLQTVPNQVRLKQGEKAFKELDTALITLDSLKVAQLQSYFANDCVIVPTQTRTDAVGQSTATAVFSTAIWEDKLMVIVSLPDGSKKIAQIPVEQKNLEAQINEFRNSLELGVRDYLFNFQPAQKVYQWLIQPFESDLKDVKTLVFVNDGLLRSVPMAALHDGRQFLIEKFALATTPSLTLTTPEKVERQALTALLMGVSEPSQVPERAFSALLWVEEELDLVSEQLPSSQTLLNQEFSIEALRQTLAEKDYRILHIATHGTFGFEPDDNFVVVGAKQRGEGSQFNQKLTIGKLDELIREINDPTREPIELLTLTACETAIGSNRATLGLAGVAIRAGVRSAIATLWSVGDESTAELISQFYAKLQDPTLTKAEALQQAQIATLKSDDLVKAHPYRWAPFILIGNWF